MADCGDRHGSRRRSLLPLAGRNPERIPCARPTCVRDRTSQWDSRIVAGKISRAMGAESPTLKDQAVLDYEMVIELLPGLWAQRENSPER